MTTSKRQAVLFDWGDTVMRNFPTFEGPMHEWPRVEAIAGVRGALDRLRPRFRLALATNAEDSDEAAIRKALNRCGLDELFDHVFCLREVGHRKPQPRFYRTVLDDLRLDASNVFMVGDSFDADVIAANDVGIAAVWFNPRGDLPRRGPAFRTIHRFEDLETALRELGAEI